MAAVDPVTGSGGDNCFFIYFVDVGLAHVASRLHLNWNNDMDNDNGYTYLIYEQTNGTGRRIMICADDGRLHQWSGRGGEFASCYEAWRRLRARRLEARIVVHNLIDLR